MVTLSLTEPQTQALWLYLNSYMPTGDAKQALGEAVDALHEGMSDAGIDTSLPADSADPLGYLDGQ